MHALVYMYNKIEIVELFAEKSNSKKVAMEPFKLPFN
jgi:hypothetical protein